jgi:hypothetical protein
MLVRHPSVLLNRMPVVLRRGLVGAPGDGRKTLQRQQPCQQQRDNREVAWVESHGDTKT